MKNRKRKGGGGVAGQDGFGADEEPVSRLHAGTFLFLTPGTCGRPQGDARGTSSIWMRPHPNPRAPSSELAGVLQPASPRLTPAGSRPPREVARAREDRQKTASRRCPRRHELQSAAAPSSGPAPRGTYLKAAPPPPDRAGCHRGGVRALDASDAS